MMSQKARKRSLDESEAEDNSEFQFRELNSYLTQRGRVIYPRFSQVDKISDPFVDLKVRLRTNAEMKTFLYGIEQTILVDYFNINELPGFLKCRFAMSSRKILIRSCYKQIFAKFLPLLTTANHPSKIAFVQGMPKVGKTMFLVYIILRIANHPNLRRMKFAVQFDQFETYLFHPFPNDKYQVMKISLGQLQNLKTCHLLLCDCCPEQMIFLQNGLTIIATSYCSESENNYFHLGQKYMLPTWSQEELAFLDSNTVTWYPRYCKYGGIPYFLLDYCNADMEKTHSEVIDALFENVIKDYGKLLLKLLFSNKLLQCDNQRDMNFVLMLVHLNPPFNSNTGQYNFDSEEYSLQFASDYIIERLNFHHPDVFLDYLRRKLSSKRSLSYLSFLPYLYELFCFTFIPFASKRLHLEQIMTEETPVKTMVLTVPSNTQKLLFGWQRRPFEENLLYLPRYHGQNDGLAFAMLKIEGSLALVLFALVYENKGKIVKEAVQEVCRFVKNQFEKILIVFLTPIAAASANTEVKMIRWTSAVSDSVPFVHCNLIEYYSCQYGYE